MLEKTEQSGVHFWKPSCSLKIVLLCALCGLGTSPLFSADNTKSPEEMEFEVKAAFIFNFMKFIQWPADKDLTSNAVDRDKPIQIAILGKNPFSSAFQQILNKNINGRTIQLLELESFEQFRRSYPNNESALSAYEQTYLEGLRKCHLLFICESEKNVADDLVTIAKGNALVTVSDIPEFASGIGMIGFVMEKQKLRFEINLDAVGNENIKISSQLLGLARRVYKKEGKSN